MARVFAVVLQTDALTECRGTNWDGRTNLSVLQNQEAGTGAVSRRKFDRSQKVVTA
jgi:hypothetical protein